LNLQFQGTISCSGTLRLGAKSLTLLPRSEEQPVRYSVPLHLCFLFVSDRFESYFWFWTYISHFIVTHLFAGLVLVDCSATYDTVSLMKDAVDHGCCIVLANKKPLTGAYVMLLDFFFSANSLSWCWIHTISCNSTKSSYLNNKCICYLQEDFQILVSNFRRIRFESTVCSCFYRWLHFLISPIFHACTHYSYLFFSRTAHEDCTSFHLR